MNQPVIVRGYSSGDRVTAPESEVRNWMFVRPDGTEEGNIVGKFLRSSHAQVGLPGDAATARCSYGPCVFAIHPSVPWHVAVGSRSLISSLLGRLNRRLLLRQTMKGAETPIIRCNRSHDSPRRKTFRRVVAARGRSGPRKSGAEAFVGDVEIRVAGGQPKIFPVDPRRHR